MKRIIIFAPCGKATKKTDKHRLRLKSQICAQNRDDRISV